MNLPKLPLIPTRWKIMLLVVSWGIAFSAGWWVRDLQADAKEARTETARVTKEAEAGERVRKVEIRGVTIAGEERDKHDTQQANIRVVYRNIIEKVPYYVPTPQPGFPGDSPNGAGLDSLPLGAVRLHDYAALAVDPPVPAPSGEPLGAPSGIGLPAFVERVASNYGVCEARATEVAAWREWYRRESATWEAYRAVKP